MSICHADQVSSALYTRVLSSACVLPCTSIQPQMLMSLVSKGLRSSSCVLIDRCMMERTLHPVSLATLQATACWVIWSTVHPIACGWSSTAMPPEPIRASASHTQVSCLRGELRISWSEMQQYTLFLMLTVSAVVYSSIASKQKRLSLPLACSRFEYSS